MTAVRFLAMLAVLIPVAFAGAAVAKGPERLLVERPGVTLEVLADGEGPVVLLIPSLGRGASDFDDLTGRLVAAGYRVVRPQPRGIGASTGPVNAISLDELAEDLAAVVDATAGGKPVDAVGHAFGQRLARTLAARHPEKVRGVVLLAAGGKVAIPGPANKALQDSFNLTLPDPVRMQAVADAFFAPGNSPAAWRDGWYPDVARYQAAASTASVVSAWWSAGRADVLIVQPLQDAIALPGNATLLQEEIGSRARRVDIDGAGHALLPEQPDAVADAILSFLRR